MSFRMACKEALKSQHKQHRLGAVIVKGHRILSTGFNEIRPSRVLDTETLHAEASAVLKLLKEDRLGDLIGADIFVTRYTRGGAIGLSLPCPHCMELLRSVGIKKVHYTLDDGTTEVMKL